MSLSPSSQSSLGAVALDLESSSHVASLSSTPPTNFSDNISIASEGIKVETTPVPEIQATVIVATEPLPEVSATPHNTSQIDAPSTAQEPPAAGRARRARVSNPVYNLSQLSGTAAKGNGRRKRASLGDALSTTPRSSDPLVRDGIDALNLQWSMQGLKTPGKSAQEKPSTPRTTRASARDAPAKVDVLTSKATSLGKRGRKAFEQGIGKVSRELLRLRDTNEFAKVETKPVYHTIWANGKLVTPEELENGPARKKAKTKVPSEVEKAKVDETKKDGEKSEETLELHTRKGRRVKRWLAKGLYAGQDTPLDLNEGLGLAEKKKLAQIPELAASGRVNKALPLPMFNGLRTLINGRDFKLPFDVCNPLPPGQPKPEHWTKISKNRFVGESSLYWKKNQHSSADESKCVCKPQDGCDEDCQNRIMLYECDENNCNVGKAFCTNRAFADLHERKVAGGKYRTGVEVIKTSDRGHGIRSNRCFDANQIIMEYTGEIITEEECENRMNTKYKNNDCYYLMSFDQNMIIDATTGSIARFVNHSCKPNCKMIKWIVGGQPRMALFAGDAPIMTGDELTYDYNFDPFSAKNVQTCLCGEAECRGVLGPKPKGPKPVKAEKTDGKAGLKKKKKVKGTKTDAKTTPKSAAKALKSPAKLTAKTQAPKAKLKETVKSVVKLGKRKLEELAGDDTADAMAKKRKIKSPKGTKQKQSAKRSFSDASNKVVKAAAKGAATVKKSVSTITVNAKSTPVAKKTTSSKVTTVRTSSSGRVIKATKKRDSLLQTTLSPNATIIAARAESSKIKAAEKGTLKTPNKTKRPATPKSLKSAVKSPRKALDLPRVKSQIRLVSPEASSITALVPPSMA
ncbi:hypothetical protein VD0002_g7883 [Verticillium dahliae]|uniref:Histone-lysine N-methyltransferase ASH1L n=1 Tax=Verticillium dahliae TaxID=27337 RepID=A0AA44W7V8_VERDA|nr:Siroheme biosynthesis protein met8 [Verticillium dahliae VDG2]PNH26533.1 hypothetical protein BJF96_g10140 [Verticillium dahliae]PNH48794.1 hypothetical protein VD0003_g8331 [Verticillium dahliae]PNH59683.1 hypothetical protein VD0002_g7883 [Verticillium dahliae]